MLCSAVLVEWLLLKRCCVDMCGMLFVLYGSSVFSSVFAITEKSEMGLYDVSMFMYIPGIRSPICGNSPIDELFQK